MAWYFRNKLFFRNKEFEHAWTKTKQNRFVQNGGGSIPIGIPISCLNTIFPIVK